MPTLAISQAEIDRISDALCKLLLGVWTRRMQAEAETRETGAEPVSDADDSERRSAPLAVA